MSPSFNHIFGGGYAAGYYGYKWAEVLDADAFSKFLENGIFDRKTAGEFRDRILARGGSKHPMELYVDFMGREPEMEALLRGARVVALGPCECREKHGNCNAPLEVCISLNEWAEETIARGRARAVTLEEALEALRLSHEAGLVHLAYRQRDKDVSLVCSCCSCCCFFLTALKRFDYHDALIESAYVASYDPTYCSSCGTCIERCPFDAWTETSEKQICFDPSRCFGCGLCVSTCPTGAISFVERAGNEE